MNEPAEDGKRSILHVTTVAATLLFVREQIGYFKAHGWNVQVLCADSPELREFGQRAGVVVHTAPMTRSVSPLRDLRALWHIARVIRSARPAVVHAHSPKAGLLAMLAATCSPSTTRIYQVRGLPLECASGVMRLLLLCSERVACRIAHRVYCDSRSLRTVLLREKICEPRKCVMVLSGRGNGVDARNRWHPAHVSERLVQQIRSDLHIPADSAIVGYVGRLARDKGLTELEQAWKLIRRTHPSAHLLVLGSLDGRDPAPAQVVDRLRADPAVHFCGHISNPVPHYALMDVVVLPSYREGLPNVLLEAAAMARPVVTTRVTGCIDAVQHGVTGFVVEPHSGKALADALDAYLKDAALRARHGRAGRERVLRDFEPEPLWEWQRQDYSALLRAREVLPVRGIAAGARRVFDITAAAILLLALSPLLGAVALAVLFNLGTPILFRQVRAGARGVPFTLHKFRTMRELHAQDGKGLAAGVPLTGFGGWLRSTSLDELPELWDVLRGRMSLVGPRPLLMEYLPHYTPEQARRHSMRPGMTGWAQTHGRNGISWDEKLKLDVWYIDHASPLLDLRILLQTIPQVFKRQNITPRDRPMMEPFHEHTA